MMEHLPPEAKILILNAACLAVAYLGIYPSMRHKTMLRLAVADLGVTLAALAAAGAMFAGTGTQFWLLGLHTGWAGFSIVTLIAMGYPLMRWFLRRHHIIPGKQA
ncbi:MAG: hypothetical protein Q4G14_09025 [Paracoccus sp. (in: a-proteobacteria)]|uniref:hypothetical protein n=1 Tax=Paracoccus sp. TaxID=267 RepID=UPI0026DFFAE3|nr:hypothetical protein [Paracoccus sp. (in: a-proteobacteria)]MDO5613367.1 hypothetical protein [Paracoccus sp. (in: a-proteobacteria)]